MTSRLAVGIECLRYRLLFLILLTVIPVPGLSGKADSLRKVLEKPGADSNRAKTLNELAIHFISKNPDTAIILSLEASKIAEQIGHKKLLGISLHIAGGAEINKGNYPAVLVYELKALKLLEETGDKQQIAKALGNLGVVYKEQGDYARALEYYFKTLKIHEDLRTLAQQNNRPDELKSVEKGIVVALCNIGVVYKILNDYDKSLDFLLKALEMAKKMDNKNFTAAIYGNLGNLYDRKGNYARALEYFLKTLKEFEEMNNKNGIATVLGNIAMSYQELEDYARAESYFFKAIQIDKEIGNRNNLARHSSNLGALRVKQNRLNEARQLFLESIVLAKEFQNKELMRDNYYNLTSLDTLTGNFKAALEHYKNYILYSDSMQNEESTKRQTQLEMQYEFDKKQAADSIRNAEALKQESLKHDQEIRQQRIYTYGGIAGFVLMLVVAGVSFNAYRQKQKANGIISHQKQLVEEKQREILDSIYYAKRIQESLLPSERYIAKKMDELRRG